MRGMPTSNNGLSPRLRGNPEELDERRRAKRSIPAPAGEPRRANLITVAHTVYPRACGGTFVVSRISWTTFGLSPRLRGNRH